MIIDVYCANLLPAFFGQSCPLDPVKCIQPLEVAPLIPSYIACCFPPWTTSIFPHHKKYGAKSYLWLILLTSAVYGIERRCTANLLFPDTTPCLFKAYLGMVHSPASIHTNIGTPTSLTGISDSPTKLSKVYITFSIHVFRR